MFPKPQCPFCGETFETLAEAIHHVDTHTGQLARLTFSADPEDTPHIPHREADDPSARVEDAG